MKGSVNIPDSQIWQTHREIHLNFGHQNLMMIVNYGPSFRTMILGKY